MKTITVAIEYATISPAVLEGIIAPISANFISWHEIDEDFFEFSVLCRQEDAALVEARLAQYV